MKKLLFILTLLFASASLFQQCTKKAPQQARRFNTSQSDGCLSCHMNTDLLKKVATPLPPVSTESGEG